MPFIFPCSNDLAAHELIAALQQRGVFLPTLVTVAHQAIDTAIEGLRLGAKDVLELPFSDGRFLHALEHALQR